MGSVCLEGSTRWLTCLDQTLQGHMQVEIEFDEKFLIKPFDLEKCLYIGLPKLNLFLLA